MIFGHVFRYKSCRRLWLVSSVVAVMCVLSCAVGTESDALHPVSKPTKTGFLKVSDLHELYWETSGNPKGIVAIGLHGGPGAGISDYMRRFFDPDRFHIILFDQRGAGRSKPKAEWRENTTQDLVEDINRIRKHLGIEGKVILWGGSWGSTLALAYAQAHPDKVAGLVLRGIFLSTSKEIEHFYHGATARFFPNNFERLKQILPHPERLDYPSQLFDLTQSEDEKIRQQAINGWVRYELRMASVNMTDERCDKIIENYDGTTFAVLENHYMKSGCFLKEGQLLDGAKLIENIPTYIVNGRYDMICPPYTAIELASRLKNVKLEIIEAAGHSYYEPAIAEALVQGLDWVAERI